ncbi:hypothetical protein LOTGIDRAFT_162039 [Lottia gigantea]|uniref:Uncharacterized protein n=1 Tax=Lottia gigantea TaxID=225164 RepID=V4BVG5_LOTGI|nr:hypothetical protein LOTGIDRAFT_162039 [Lottia gigantea]ESO93014.1 hypothetical protein LOTGIDRAFT_162039 [Lottia gigantea]
MTDLEDDAARSVASTSAFTVEEHETESRARRSRKSSNEYLEMRDSEILEIEKERLEVEKKRLSIESKRLEIEQRRLQIEEKRLQLEMMQKASYKYQCADQNSYDFESNEPIYTTLKDFLV